MDGGGDDFYAQARFFLTTTLTSLNDSGYLQKISEWVFGGE